MITKIQKLQKKIEALQEEISKVTREDLVEDYSHD